MTFRNRAAAGLALADALAPVLAPPFVVGAIPRGGVTVALPLVERFHAPLALVYASKLTSPVAPEFAFGADRKSTRLNSSHSQISYAVFCLKKKNTLVDSC